MRRFLLRSRGADSLLVRSQAQRTATSLPTLPRGSDSDSREDEAPSKFNPRQSFKRLSMKKLRRSKSARRSNEKKTVENRRIRKEDIGAPQNADLTSLSNESGYGSMSRKNAHLRPGVIGDEDVFTRSYSTRLSNGDFPSDDGLYVEALWDHVTMYEDELAFRVGDVIRVIDMSNPDWWFGERDAKQGWFPATFVRVLVNQYRDDEENDDVNQNDDTISIVSNEYYKVTTFDEDEICHCEKQTTVTARRCDSCGKTIKEANGAPNRPHIIISAPSVTYTRSNSATRDQIRKNVINEIVNSEKVFVGHLRDVVQGYMTRCRKRTDMFTKQQISVLFRNIEKIYDFQRKFAADLEATVDRNSIHSTELGQVFLNHRYKFSIYSEYCNNHPQATAMLSEMLTDKKYMHFFEASRLLQKMIEIPLDGFLLTPVQKICKYPLQLAELLKYTTANHPDYEPVKAALEMMKKVARMINERKRKMENIRKISLWQASIMNWKGEDVLARSNELVHSGEVSVFSQSKNKPKKSRNVFLFDHQMIVCKKDLLRKDMLYYKKRYNLDVHDVIPIEGSSLRSSRALSGDWSSTGSGSYSYGWKLTNKSTGESTVMLCKNDDDYDKWMKFFPMEREIALSQTADDVSSRENLTKQFMKEMKTSPQKLRAALPVRTPSYRHRVKMAEDINQASSRRNDGEKSPTGFIRNVSIKLNSLKRGTTPPTHQRS